MESESGKEEKGLGSSGAVDGFTRRKEQSKKNIRQAAWELFGQFGVEKASIADIARKAGVSQATIYNNFGSKEALAREFVTSVVEELVDRVQEVLAPELGFQEKMAAFVQFISTMMAHEGPPAVDSTVFTDNRDLWRDPEISKIRDAAQARMTRLLLGVVQEGRSQGQVSAVQSEEALSIYFEAFMDIYTDPQLQLRFSSHPGLVHELGWLMTYGLGGQPK